MANFEVGLVSESGKANFKLFRVPAGKTWRVTCTTRSWVSVETHWQGHGTELCDGPLTCKACAAGVRIDWKAYVVAEGFKENPNAIIELTRCAAFDLKQYKWRAESLLGARLVVTRQGKEINSPLTAAIVGWTDVQDEVSVENLTHCIKTIYRCNPRQLVLKVSRSS